MNFLTDEEAYAIGEYYLNNPPESAPSKARRRIPMVRIDSVTADSLLSLSQKCHKTPEEIVRELVRERVAADA